MRRREPTTRAPSRSPGDPENGARARNLAEEIYARAMTGTYEGKRGLVLGVANRRSIAWAIAKRLADRGAQLAFTYQGERLEKTVRELADSVSSPHVTACGVRADAEVERVFAEVGATVGGQVGVL